MDCPGCYVSYREFYRNFNTEETVYDYLANHGVVLKTKLCETCGQPCHRDFVEGDWRCGRQITNPKNKRKIRCNYKSSLRKGSKLKIDDIVTITTMFIKEKPPKTTKIEEELPGLSKPTIIDWLSFAREVCIDWCADQSEQIGGEGVVVEIDEAKFGKRKYNRGRIVEGKWVFGGIERGTRKIFLTAVPDRTSGTLLEIIKQHIKPNTTIISDCWKAYNCLQEEGFTHLAVNHSLNFVDPETGAHTQNIERTWRDVRASVPRYGTIDEHMAGHLAEYMMRRAVPNSCERVHHFWLQAAKLYPPH